MYFVQQEPIQFHLSNPTFQTQDQSTKIEGRWNNEEHLKFLNAIMCHGKDWKKVQEEVQTRTGAQVRSHAQKYFLKITKIIKDRKKIKGKKMPNNTDTELQLMNYFANHPLTPNTPKQVIELIKIQKVGIKKIIEENYNGKQFLYIEQLLAPTTKIQKKKSQPQQKQNPISQKNLFSLIQEQMNQNHQDSSFLTQLILRKKQYFLNGGLFSKLIDYGNEIKKQKTNIYDQETTGGLRKFSFTQFNNDNDNENSIEQ